LSPPFAVGVAEPENFQLQTIQHHSDAGPSPTAFRFAAAFFERRQRLCIPLRTPSLSLDPRSTQHDEEASVSTSRRHRMAGIRAFALSLLVIAPPASALAEPIFAVSGSTAVTTFDDPVLDSDVQTSLLPNADTLPPISSSLTGSGTAEGLSGSATIFITDTVIGGFVTGTSAGSGPSTAEIVVNASGAYLDYFTVLLPEGSLVPMLFTLDPSYTITTTGGPFNSDLSGYYASLRANLQVGGGGSEIPTIGSLLYNDVCCFSGGDLLTTTIELMVPTGVPFRVQYDMQAWTRLRGDLPGTGTVDASHTLQLFADPVGNYTYETTSGNNFLSGAAPVPVPEPATLFILGSGLGWLGYRRRRIR
jgi:hypothetical protein